MIKPCAVLCSLAPAWLATIFAQAEPVSAVAQGAAASGWISVIIQSGSFGLIAYLIIQGLPKLQADFKAERAAERAEFLAALEAINEERKKERADFGASLQALTGFTHLQMESVRVTAKGEVEALRKTFSEEQREMRTFYAGETSAMRTLYMDAVAAMRTAVHDVRDVAGVTMNRATVAAEAARRPESPK